MRGAEAEGRSGRLERTSPTPVCSQKRRAGRQSLRACPARAAMSRLAEPACHVSDRRAAMPAAPHAPINGGRPTSLPAGWRSGAYGDECEEGRCFVSVRRWVRICGSLPADDSNTRLGRLACRQPERLLSSRGAQQNAWFSEIPGHRPYEAGGEDVRRCPVSAWAPALVRRLRTHGAGRTWTRTSPRTCASSSLHHASVCSIKKDNNLNCISIEYIYIYIYDK